MAINSLWQQYLRVENIQTTALSAGMQRHDMARIFSLWMSGKLKKIKMVPRGKQLSEQEEPQIIDRYCSFWHQSSVIHRKKHLFWGWQAALSIVSYLFTFPMLSHDFSVIKLLISLVFKWSSKEINLTQHSFLEQPENCWVWFKQKLEPFPHYCKTG